MVHKIDREARIHKKKFINRRKQRSTGIICSRSSLTLSEKFKTPYLKFTDTSYPDPMLTDGHLRSIKSVKDLNKRHSSK